MANACKSIDCFKVVEEDRYSHRELPASHNTLLWPTDSPSQSAPPTTQRNLSLTALAMNSAPKGMATIKLASGKKFNIHIDKLAFECNYFRTSLTSSFSEAESKQVYVDNVGDEEFRHFPKWLESGSIQPGLELCGLVNLWVFGFWRLRCRTRSSKPRGRSHDQQVSGL